MELRQLEYLVTVVEEASFTRAAARVHISQSGVSAQIRELERELGQPLLDRTQRTVRPTQVGAAILPLARSALTTIDTIRQTIDEYTGLLRGHVAVGMVTACGFNGLFDELSGFRRTHPGVEITLSEDNSDRLVEEVAGGRLDLALVGLGSPPPPSVESCTILEERLVAAVGPDDDLARRGTVALRRLSGRTLICLPRGTGVRTAFDQACAAQSLQVDVALEASSPMVVAGLARRGLGTAILTESMVGPDQADLRAVAVIEPSIRSRLALVWKRGAPTTPTAAALVAHMAGALGPAG
jgi:DNA-binding transcriptional LysR family regulator